MIKEHWAHHRPLCINGLICIDKQEWSQSFEDEMREIGLRVCFSLVTKQEGDIDRNIRALEETGKSMAGKWFLTLDSDEYIPPFEFDRVAAIAAESEINGHTWAHGWLCDRLAPFGIIGEEPTSYSYADLIDSFPVAADVVRRIQGSCNSKVFLSRKPSIGYLHYANGSAHPSWVRLDHFKWFGGCIGEITERLDTPWSSEYRRLVEHYKSNGRIRVENYLSDLWGPIHGWFDFWQVYIDAVIKLRGKKAVMVEVGVWQGKSALFLLQYALASGLDFHLWLVDRFRGCEATGPHLRKIGRELSDGSSFIKHAVTNIHECGLANHASFLQCDSIVGSKIFDDGCCDFIFIDADHSYDAVRADLSNWFPKLKSGGVIAGHDYGDHRVRKAVTDYFAEKNLEVREVKGSWVVDLP